MDQVIQHHSSRSQGQKASPIAPILYSRVSYHLTTHWQYHHHHQNTRSFRLFLCLFRYHNQLPSFPASPPTAPSDRASGWGVVGAARSFDASDLVELQHSGAQVGHRLAISQRSVLYLESPEKWWTYFVLESKSCWQKYGNFGEQTTDSATDWQL